MRCDRARELILTDFLDGELKPDTKRELAEHLDLCSECRSFEKSARERAVSPFRRSGMKAPPGSTWEYIKESIAEEERLRRYRKAPIPVYAATVIVSLLLVAAAVTRFYPFKGDPLNDYISEQAEFLVFLGANGVEYPDGYYTDLDLLMD